MSHPSPAQMPGRFGATAASAEGPGVDPDVVVREVGDLLDRVDEVRRSAADHDAHDGPVDLTPLSAQADLLEQAHDVLTTALEQLDRV
ncbi:hypothetical protein ACQ7HM_17485 [Williamsia sp. MIQD14]|uniref:hypothetical protein n=1 Tax=Williamsia sp. MIQD14 TaxID=3425703 RepID=UPI003DA18B81